MLHSNGKKLPLKNINEDMWKELLSSALYKELQKIMSMSKTLHIGQVYQSEQSKTGWKKGLCLTAWL